MKKPTIIWIGLLAIVTVLSACSVLRAPEEASAPIEAVPLQVETGVDADAAARAVEESLSEAVAVEESETAQEPSGSEADAATDASESSFGERSDEDPTVEEEMAEDPKSEPEMAADEVPAEAMSAGLTVYTISQEESQVRFELDEELAGQPKTVVGITDQLAGEIALDLSDLSTAQVGVILVNARGFQTDNNFRNRAIHNRILQTGLFEFITFTPTGIEGLPASADVGDEVNFTISGDLTILDITQPATFAVSATAVSETQISGTASTVVAREAYDLRIPSVPDVANVEEEVELYIAFVANA